MECIKCLCGFSILSREEMKRKEPSGKALKRVEKFNQSYEQSSYHHTLGSECHWECWKYLLKSINFVPFFSQSLTLPSRPPFLILKFIHHQHFIFISLLPPPRVLLPFLLFADDQQKLSKWTFQSTFLRCCHGWMHINLIKNKKHLMLPFVWKSLLIWIYWNFYYGGSG